MAPHPFARNGHVVRVWVDSLTPSWMGQRAAGLYDWK